MAKISLLKSALLVATILGGSAAVTPTAFAQTDQELLNQAQEAEVNGYWQAAEDYYRKLLERYPNRADFWNRLGDIVAQQGRVQEAAEIFGRAADLSPNNLVLQKKAANAHSAIEKPEKAIEFLNRAVRLDANDPDLWYSKSTNESWIGRYADAEASLQSAFRAGLPRTADHLSRLATLQQWQGKDVASQATISELSRLNPDEPAALLATARLEGWAGNYYKALKLLERYRANGGDELTYAQETAIFLAWSDQPEESMRVSDTALQNYPGDKTLELSQVVANYRAGDFDTAFAIQESLEAKAQPGDLELADIRRRIIAPIRSNLTITSGFTTDRDNVDIIGGEVVYTQALNRHTFLGFGFEGWRAKADPFSGLDRIDNWGKILKHGVFAEVDTKLGKNVWGNVKVGASFLNFNTGNRTIAQVGAGLRVRTSDHLWVKFGFDRDHYLITPRALSLGIIRNEEYVEFVWTPDPRYFVQLRFTAAQHSDTNRQKRGDLTIIRQISRQPNLKVDAGFNAVWFGYKFQLGNGYYDPNFYQRYLFPLYFTIKITDDDNVVLTIAPGMQKDDTFKKFKFAGAATLETTHGLYRDWQLKTRWTVYVGGSESALILAPATDYWIVGGTIMITRRF